jgi:hypothetical protein
MFLSLEKSIDQIAIDWDRIDRYNIIDLWYRDYVK